MLTVLLSDPDKVFSKQEILDSVWAGKSVAEQSIFQCIRNLRAEFGESAIVTHPKKGYQWTISLNEQKTPKVETAPVKRDSVNKKLLVLVFIVFLLFFFIELNKAPDVEPALISYSHDIHTGEDETEYSKLISELTEKLTNQKRYELKEIARSEERKFLYSVDSLPKVFFEKTNADIHLSIDIKALPNKWLLTYKILSTQNAWTGAVSHNSYQELAQLAETHITRVVSSGALNFNKKSVRLITAQLVLMAQNFPEDATIVDNLITNYIHLGEFEQAELLVKKLKGLAKKNYYSQYRTKALLVESELAYKHSKFELAEQLLNQVTNSNKAQFTNAELSKVALYKAKLFARNGDYRKLKAHLLETVDTLNDENSPILVVEQLFVMSLIANTFNQENDRDVYLSMAKYTIDSHGLSDKLKADVFYYQGYFEEAAGNHKKATKHYRQVLDTLPGISEIWAKEQALSRLAKIFSENKQFQLAISLIDINKNITPEESLLIAEVYKQWGKLSQAKEYAQKSFEIAVDLGQLEASLNASLFIVELNQLTLIPSIDKHKDFLVKSAFPRWLKTQRTRLESVGIHKG